MTWAFAFLVSLIVGLVLGGVTGLIKDLRSLARRHLVVPHPDQHSAFLAILGRRLACGLVVFGLVGLILGVRNVFEPPTVLALAGAAALAAILLGSIVLRRPCVLVAASGRAIVVREMPPGGYGQIRLTQGNSAVVLAAQSIDPEPLPAGAEVVVVDCTRSVVTVRRPV